MNNRVIHFEIHARDPVKMAKFYENVFGWEIKEWTPPDGVKLKDENRYWGIMTAPMDSKEMGIDGNIFGIFEEDKNATAMELH
ncbi:MAG: VOC family protein [Candidatus Paceibacterota bacterium]|jgi:hypothetical protein